MDSNEEYLVLRKNYLLEYINSYDNEKLKNSVLSSLLRYFDDGEVAVIDVYIKTLMKMNIDLANGVYGDISQFTAEDIYLYIKNNSNLIDLV